MSSNNRSKDLEVPSSENPSNFVSRISDQVRGNRKRPASDSKNTSWCRCCLKVKRRSQMLNDEFCDSGCWSEFQRNGNRIVIETIDADMSVCCKCNKEVLVMLDGSFQPIAAYQCVACRTRVDQDGYGQELSEQRWEQHWLRRGLGSSGSELG